MVAEAAPSRDEFLSRVIDQVQADLQVGQDQGHASPADRSTTTRSTRRWSSAAATSPTSSTWSGCASWSRATATATPPSACCTSAGTRCPGGSRTTSRCRSSTCTSRCTPRCSGPEGKPVELQIRTDEMHRRAEYGVAAHWKYKEGKGVPLPAKGGDDAGDLVWVRQLLDWQRETADPGEFLDSLRFEINSTEVYAFTPKGDVVSLPQGSTPIDFAYAIHTEVGNKTIGARVNGRLVPLESALANGDVVEIFTSKAQNAGPEPRLADLRPQPAGAEQDPALLHPRAARGVDRERQGGAGPADAQGRPAAAAAADPGAPDRGRRLLQAGRRHRPCTPRSARARVGAQAVVNRLIIVEGGDEMVADETSEDRVVTGRRQAHRQRRPRRVGHPRDRRQRPAGQAGQVLYAGAGRPDHGFRHQGLRASRCTGPTASTRPACAPSPSG